MAKKKPTLNEVLRISIDENNNVIVHGRITDKKQCMWVIGDALKAIAMFKPKEVKIKPPKKPHIVHP